MTNRINAYLDSVIPKSMPKKKRQELIDEYISHIYEKIDLYKEIGFAEDDALEKALSEMGNTDETKKEINASFEKLYKERTFMAVLWGLAVFLMNMSFGGAGLWVMSADSNGKPEAESVLISFVAVVFVLSLVSFLHIKGYRKSLISVGVANLLVGGTMLICFYPQCFFYGLTVSTEYILELYTPAILREFNVYNSEIITYYGAMLFTLLLSVFCFVTSSRIKKKGLPKKGAKNKVGAVISAFLVLGLVAFAPYENAVNFFRDYPVWFQEYNDGIREEEQIIFGMLDESTTFEEAKSLLSSMGYTDTESYKSTLDKVRLKQFEHNLKNMNIITLDTTMIYFNKEYIKKNISQYKGDGNSFIIIDKDEKGMLSYKGIGSLSDDIKSGSFGQFRHYGHRQDNIKKCQTYFFDKFKKGDSKKDVLSFFGAEQGEIYSCITEYSDIGRLDIVKVYINGCLDETDIKDYTAYLEFTFENDKLLYAHMFAEYFDGSDFQEKTYVIK